MSRLGPLHPSVRTLPHRVVEQLRAETKRRVIARVRADADKRRRRLLTAAVVRGETRIQRTLREAKEIAATLHQRETRAFAELAQAEFNARLKQAGVKVEGAE